MESCDVMISYDVSDEAIVKFLSGKRTLPSNICWLKKNNNQKITGKPKLLHRAADVTYVHIAYTNYNNID